MTIEIHPLEPFLPVNAKILFLGSFPPPKARWSMDFFYPNWINDFWRIQGLIHFGDVHYFEAQPIVSASEHSANGTDIGELKKAYESKNVCGLKDKADPSVSAPHRFDKERIAEFCKTEGLAFFDTARKVRRLKDNADDNFLEIVEGTDVFALLSQLPCCQTVVTTGGKAGDELQSYFESRGFSAAVPKVGECISLTVPSGMITTNPSTLTWWRMPSTSRAYPLKLEKKADYYRRLFGKS